MEQESQWKIAQVGIFFVQKDANDTNNVRGNLFKRIQRLLGIELSNGYQRLRSGNRLLAGLTLLKDPKDFLYLLNHRLGQIVFREKNPNVKLSLAIN